MFFRLVLLISFLLVKKQKKKKKKNVLYKYFFNQIKKEISNLVDFFIKYSLKQLAYSASLKVNKKKPQTN